MYFMERFKDKNYFIFIIAAIAGLGGFLFGFDSSVIADTKDQIVSQFSLSDWTWSLVVSVSLLGSMIGIPMSGMIADRISRKTLLTLVAIGFMIGTLLCGSANQLNALLAGRFLIGICIGIASYISPLFISEMAPANIRGGLILMNGLAITFGQAFSFLIGYFLHDLSLTSWRWLFLIGTLPAVSLLVGILFVPHSPRFIIAKKGREAAYQALKKIRQGEEAIQQELDEIQTCFARSPVTFSSLRTTPFIFVLIIGVMLGVFQQFTGINSIMYYGPVIFETAGFHPIKTAILATFWMGLLNFIFTAVTLFFVDRLGRRFLLLSGSLLAAISLFLIVFSNQVHFISPKWVIFCFMSTYIIGYCVSVGSLFWVVISEIYPQKVRGLAMSIATSIQWGANFVVSISFLSIWNRVGEAKTFGLFVMICLLTFIFVYYFIPETTNISLEKIEENLMKGKKLRELGQPLQVHNRNVLGEIEIENEI